MEGTKITEAPRAEQKREWQKDRAVALGHYETIIHRNMPGYLLTGYCLKQIREHRLYQANYSSFDEYCTKRWGFHRRIADRLVKASDIVFDMILEMFPEGLLKDYNKIQSISPLGGDTWYPNNKDTDQDIIEYISSLDLSDFPRREFQLRALSEVPEPERKAVWDAAKEKAYEAKIETPTADMILESHAEQKNPAPVIHKDCLGNKIPDSLVPAFDQLEKFRKLQKLLTSVKYALEEIAASPAKTHIQRGEIKALIANMRGILSYVPYAKCPYCRADKAAMELCKPCKGSGWLCRSQYKFASKELGVQEGSNEFDDL